MIITDYSSALPSVLRADHLISRGGGVKGIVKTNFHG